MRIRAITIGNRLSLPLSVADRAKVKAAGDFCQAARTAVQAAGFEVQTLRFACQPLSEALSPGRYGDVAEYAQELEAEVLQGGIDYCSVGPVLALSSEQPERLIDELPRILGCTSRVFASVLAATTKEGISLEALEASARALKEVSAKFPDGAGARRFAIGGNVPPHGPFFPTGYHKGRKPGFSLAIEAADLAVAAFTEATTLDEARADLRRLLVNDCRRLEAVCRNLEVEWGVKFHGIDICLAPYPEERRSIGFAIEKLVS